MIDLKPSLDKNTVKTLLSSSSKTHEEVDEIIKKYQQNQRSILMGFEKQATILGLIGLTVPEKSHGIIEHIAVDERFKRNGIGREMLNYVIDTYHLTYINVCPVNGSEEFFQKNGFEGDSDGMLTLMKY